MARIRSIKPEFFTSLTVGALSPTARLTFIGLWTYADDDGRAVDDPRLIRAAVWPLDDRTAAEVDGDLRALATAGLIVRYGAEGKRYLAIRAWEEHQKVSHPRPSRYPTPPESSGNPPEDSGAPPPRGGAEQGAGSREMEQGSGRGSTETLPNGSGGQAADEDEGEVIDADVEVIEPGENEPRPVPANVIPIRSREELPDRVGADDIVAEWLRRQPERPPEGTIRKQGAVAKRLAEGCTRRDLQMAFVGIEQLFPYSNGEPWDLFDLERKLAKAKAAAVNHPRMREARMEAELDAALDALDLGGAA